MLNRPDRLNALNNALGQALLDALNGAMRDHSVRAVVLTGAGRGFCAGGDIDVLRKAREREDVTEVEALLKVGKQIVLAIATMPKPVIAAVNGPAAGAGANLALACTTRIASEQANFTQSFAKIGLFPDFGGTYFLPRLVGPALATELVLSAETVSAAEALRIGLVPRVVPPDRLEAETYLLADKLAAAPPIVARGINQALRLDDREQLEKALDEEIRWQVIRRIALRAYTPFSRNARLVFKAPEPPGLIFGGPFLFLCYELCSRKIAPLTCYITRGACRSSYEWRFGTPGSAAFAPCNRLRGHHAVPRTAQASASIPRMSRPLGR